MGKTQFKIKSASW